jgi:hypothetical protein
MKALQVALTAAEVALAKDQPLGPLLERLNAPRHHQALRDAARLAQRGQLTEALRRLGAEALTLRVATQWPRAYGAARRAAETVHTGHDVARARLGGLAVYFGLVWGIQALASLVLSLKVWPLFATMAQQQHSAAPGPAQLAVDLMGNPALGWVSLALWVGLGLWVVARAPWRRLDGEALSAAVASALVAQAAPAEVLAPWLEAFELPPGAVVSAGDLALVSTRAAASARRRAERFATLSSYVMWSWLSLRAVLILTATYQAIAALPGGVR